MVSIGTLEIAIKADLSDYNRAKKTLEQDQGLKFHIVPTVDHKNLVALNRHFSEKEDHHKKVQKGFNQNPLTPKVDLRELNSLTKAYQDLSELRDSLTSGNGQVTFVVEHIYKQEKEGSKPKSSSSNESSSEASQGSGKGKKKETLIDELNHSTEKAVNSVVGFVTSPFKGIGRGFFEGIGSSFSKEITKGFQEKLGDKGNINLKDLGSKVGDYVVDKINKDKNQNIRTAGTSSESYQRILREDNSIVQEAKRVNKRKSPSSFEAYPSPWDESSPSTKSVKIVTACCPTNKEILAEIKSLHQTIKGAGVSANHPVSIDIPEDVREKQSVRAEIVKNTAKKAASVGGEIVRHGAKGGLESVENMADIARNASAVIPKPVKIVGGAIATAAAGTVLMQQTGVAPELSHAIAHYVHQWIGGLDDSLMSALSHQLNGTNSDLANVLRTIVGDLFPIEEITKASDWGGKLANSGKAFRNMANGGVLSSADFVINSLQSGVKTSANAVTDVSEATLHLLTNRLEGLLQGIGNIVAGGAVGGAAIGASKPTYEKLREKLGVGEDSNFEELFGNIKSKTTNLRNSSKSIGKYPNIAEFIDKNEQELTDTIKLAQEVFPDQRRKLGRQLAEVTKAATVARKSLPSVKPDIEKNTVQKIEEIKQLDGELQSTIAKLQKELEDLKKNTKPSTGVNEAYRMNVSDIHADPSRFQYKLVANSQSGASGSLKGVNKDNFDHGSAGVITVWKDPKDNKFYVINGHNRLAKVKEIGVESVNVLEIEAKDAKEARAKGALQNIREGQGSILDAADFFRLSGINSHEQLKQLGIPLTQSKAEMGLGVSKLPSDLYSHTLQGTIPVERASILGNSGLDDQKIREIAKLAEKNKLDNSKVKAIIYEIKSSMSQQQTISLGLFDDYTNSILGRVELITSIQKKLDNQIALLKNVADTKKGNFVKVEGIGSLDSQKASQLLADTVTAKDVFAVSKNQNKYVSGLLDKGSKMIASGGDKEAVSDSLVKMTRGISPMISKGQDLSKAGEDTIKGFIKGLENEKGELDATTLELASELPLVFKKVLGIASPSKVFFKIGTWAIQGLADGFKDKSAIKEIEKMVSAIEDLVASSMPHIGAAIGQGISKGVGNTVKDLGNNIGKDLLGGIKKSLGIASPSKEGIKIGDEFGKGLEIGIDNSLTEANKEAIAKVQKLLKEVKAVIAKDLKYLDLVGKGDTDSAQKLVNQQAKKAGYKPHSDFRDSHSAPSNSFATDSEVMEDGQDASLVQVAKGVHQQPDDYFDPVNGPRYYGYRDKAGMEAFRNLKKAIDSTNSGVESQIELYRAVPKNIKGNFLENRDWVSPSLDYVKMHGENRFDGKYRVISQSVPASQVFWDGNDIREWGFDDAQERVYKNTPNNVKSFNPLERDNKGRIVPLSKRFDSSVADIRGNLNPVAPNEISKKLEAAIKVARESGNKSAIEFVEAMTTKINHAFGSENLVGAGKNIVSGLEKGIKSLSSKPSEALTEITKDTIKKTKKSLDIASPSKVFVEIGKNVIIGYELGINGEIERIKQLNIPIPQLEKQGWVNIESLTNDLTRLNQVSGELQVEKIKALSQSLMVTNGSTGRSMTDIYKDRSVDLNAVIPNRNEDEKRIQQEYGLYSQIGKGLNIGGTVGEVSQLAKTGQYNSRDIEQLIFGALRKATNKTDLVKEFGLSRYQPQSGSLSLGNADKAYQNYHPDANDFSPTQQSKVGLMKVFVRLGQDSVLAYEIGLDNSIKRLGVKYASLSQLRLERFTDVKDFSENVPHAYKALKPVMREDVNKIKPIASTFGVAGSQLRLPAVVNQNPRSPFNYEVWESQLQVIEINAEKVVKKAVSQKILEGNKILGLLGASKQPNAIPTNILESSGKIFETPVPLDHWTKYTRQSINRRQKQLIEQSSKQIQGGFVGQVTLPSNTFDAKILKPIQTSFLDLLNRMVRLFTNKVNRAVVPEVLTPIDPWSNTRQKKLGSDKTQTIEVNAVRVETPVSKASKTYQEIPDPFAGDYKKQRANINEQAEKERQKIKEKYSVSPETRKPPMGEETGIIHLPKPKFKNTQENKKKASTKKLEQEVVTAIEEGSVEFYENQLRKIRSYAKKAIPNNIQDKDHVLDSLFTSVFSGAQLFMPQLAPAMALAPMAMPYLPTGVAMLGVMTTLGPILSRIENAIKVVEPIQMKYATVMGDKQLGRAKMGEVEGIANKYSIDAKGATDYYSQFASAVRGTNTTDSEILDFYEAVAGSIKAVGATTEDTSLIFLAYTQLLSKGKLTMEEIRQQLAEKFPPAAQVFAKALGTSTAGLEDLISRGAVSTDQWLPKVTKVLREDFGKAALSAGDNYTSALTRIENANFKLSQNFTDTYAPIFAGVAKAGEFGIGIVNKNFKLLNMLAIAGITALGVSFAAGLTHLLKVPTIATNFTKITNIVLVAWKSSWKTLTPFMLGIVADSLDDIFGTKNSLIDNMNNGITNILKATVFKGEGTKFSNPFEPMIEGFNKFKSMIPSGVVEMGALVLMFEQVRALGKIFLVPTLQNFGYVFNQMGKAIKDMVTDGKLAKRSLGELASGTLIGLTGVNQKDVIKKNKADFDKLRSDYVNNNKQLEGYKQERENLINNRMGVSGLGRKEAIAELRPELQTLKQNFNQNLDGDALVQYHQKRDDLINRRMGQAARARALMVAGQVALEAGLALGIMSFARGDFSNNIGSELNKAKESMITAIDGMKAALNDLKLTALDVADGVAKIKLPSKGAELSIPKLFGLSEKGYKSDDLINDINKHKKALDLLRGVSDSFNETIDNLASGPHPAGKLPQMQRDWLTGLIQKSGMVPNSSQDNVKNIETAKKLGIDKYYITDKNLMPTIAQEQVLSNASDLSGLKSELEKRFTNQAYDVKDLSKPLTQEYRALINEVNAIDKELENKGAKRLNLATINTTQSRKEISLLDIEINSLLKERKDKVMPFMDIEDNLKDAKKAVTTITKMIEDDKDSPSALKRIYQEMLKETSNFVKSQEAYLKGQGIGKLAQPLLDVWDSVINKLRDVDLALQKVKTGNEKSFAQAQIKLYKSNLGTVALSPALQKESLKDLQNQESLLQQTIDKKQVLLDTALRIANVGDTSEKKSKIEEIKKEILDASKELDNTRVGIAKTLYEINNNFIAEDALRNYKRSLEDWNLEMKRQAIDYTQQIESYRREVEDAGISASRENRDLAESFSDLMFDLQTQLKTAQNEFIDIQDKIKNTKFKNDIESTSPYDTSIGKKFSNIFASLFDKLSGSESESRKLEMEQQNIGKEYVSTLRNITREQEKQFDAEKNRTRALVDMANRSVMLMMEMQQKTITNMRNWEDKNLQNNRENRGMAGFKENQFSRPQSMPQMPVMNQSAPVSSPITVQSNLLSNIQRSQGANIQVNPSIPQNNIVSTTPKHSIYSKTEQDARNQLGMNGLRVNGNDYDPEFHLPQLNKDLGIGQQPIQTPSPIPVSFAQPAPISVGVNLNMNPETKEMLKRLILAEAGGEGIEGQAAVARAIINRHTMINKHGISPGTYFAKSGSLHDIMTARSPKTGKAQFSPFDDGRINKPFTPAQLAQAEAAIAIAQDPNSLRNILQRAGLNPSQATKAVNATGFRNTGMAKDDPSQNHNTVQLRNHRFNGDQFSKDKLRALNFGIPEGLNDSHIVAGNVLTNLWDTGVKTFNQQVKEAGRIINKVLTPNLPKSQPINSVIERTLGVIQNTPLISAPKHWGFRDWIRQYVLYELKERGDVEKVINAIVKGNITDIARLDHWFLEQKGVSDSARKEFNNLKNKLNKKSLNPVIKKQNNSVPTRPVVMQKIENDPIVEREKFNKQERAINAKAPVIQQNKPTPPKTQIQPVNQPIQQQVYQPIQAPVWGGNTPIDPSVYRSDFTQINDYPSQIYDQRLQNNQASQELTAEQKRGFGIEAKNQIILFQKDLEIALRKTNESIRDQAISTQELIQNSKGYLTVQEEIAKAGNDVATQYLGITRSITDQVDALNRELLGMEEQKRIAKEQVDIQLAKGTITQEQADRFKALADSELSKAESLKTAQIASLEITRKEVAAKQNSAKASAEILRAENLRIESLTKIADLGANIATARYNQGGTLINEASIIKARIDGIKMLRDAERAYKEDNSLGSDYVTKTKELADINLSQSYVDAIPFLKDFSTGLKDVVLRTSTWQESLKKLLDLANSTVIDQFLIKPFQNMIAGVAKDWGLFGGEAPGMNAPKVASDLIQNNIVPTGQFGVETVTHDQVVTDSLKTFNDALGNSSEVIPSAIQSITDGSITQGAAIALFTQGLIQATLALQSFALAAGGQSVSGLGGIFGSLFNSGNAAAGASLGGYSGIMQGILPFAKGGPIINRAEGGPVAEIGMNAIAALQKEKAMNGGQPTALIAATVGEYVLTKEQASDYLAEKENAHRWNNLQSQNTQIMNRAQGGSVGNVSAPVGRGGTVNNVGGDTINLYLDSRNDMGYSLDQLARRGNLQNDRAVNRFR